jgi:L-asparaginase
LKLQKQHILILYTGGTIGMVPDPTTGVLRAYDLETLMKGVPELSRFPCDFDFISFDSPIDSSDMNISCWQQLGKWIADSYYDYDGFVVLHGSDTMAFTASILSFMLQGLNKPIILTGSQLPIGVMRSDARENLITSIEIALSRWPDGRPRVPEVAVYFEYDLYRGNRVFKDNAEDFEAFRSANYPKLAEVGVNIKFNDEAILKPIEGSFRFYPELNNSLNVVYLFPGISPDQIRHSLISNPSEVQILLSFGSGNVPSDEEFVKVYAEAIELGKVIINVTQCRIGSVRQGLYSASLALKDMGVVSGSDITIEAAMAKLMHLLGKGLRNQALKDAFVIPICGEMKGIEFL